VAQGINRPAQWEALAAAGQPNGPAQLHRMGFRYLVVHTQETAPPRQLQLIRMLRAEGEVVAQAGTVEVIEIGASP
jgi:hypothetical protein